MKNKFLPAMLISLLLAGSSMFSSLAAGNDTVVISNIGKSTFSVNGVVKKIDSNSAVTPVLISNSTYVPIRSIIESFGGKVDWNAKQQKITITLNKNKVELWLNKKEALVNGKKVTTALAPKSVGGRTMVPLKLVSEKLGLYVNWDGSTKGISICSSNDYVALVGSEKITKPEFNVFLNSAKMQILNSNAQNSSQTGSTTWNPDDTKAVAAAKQMALNYCKQQEICLIKAKENKLSLTQDEINNVNNQISSIIQQFGSKEAAEQYIKQNLNISLAEYTEFTMNYTLAQKYINSEFSKIQIPDSEVLNTYNSNKSSYDQVTVKHILLSTVDSQGKALSDAEVKKVETKANEILAKVKSGEDFAALAKQYSEDPGSKDNGGEYTFSRGQMVQEFEDWSFNAKDGDVGIIKTVYGYHIMKFVKRSTFDDVKPTILNTLKSSMMDKIVNTWISDSKYTVIKNQSVYDAIKVK